MSQFNFIYAEEHLSHREKTVYIYLRDRAVQRALSDLERRQHIEKQNRRRANGSLTSNLYRLTKRKTSQPPAKGGL